MSLKQQTLNQIMNEETFKKILEKVNDDNITSEKVGELLYGRNEIIDDEDLD